MLLKALRSVVHLRDTLDMDAKRKEWRIERVGWVLILLLVLLAGAGLAGEGPLSSRVVTQEVGGGEVRAEYERWNRLAHVTLLVVDVHAPSVQGEELVLSFDPTTASRWTIRSSHPSGEGRLGPDGLSYAFPVDDWAQPFTVGFEYVPQEVGRTTTLLTAAAGDAAPVVLTLDQWIHP